MVPNEEWHYTSTQITVTGEFELICDRSIYFSWYCRLLDIASDSQSTRFQFSQEAIIYIPSRLKLHYVFQLVLCGVPDGATNQRYGE